MSEKIERGDVVTVVMSRNDVFPWQTAPRFTAVFQWAPAGEGGTYTLKAHGRILHLNGNSSDFIGLYREGY